MKGWRELSESDLLNRSAVAPAGKPTKFHSKSVVVDGIRFDSKHEAARWQELQMAQRAGVIQSLQRQVNLALTVRAPHGADVRIGDLRLDFVYRENGVTVYEDAKGYASELWTWKRKHWETQTGQVIRIT